MKTTIPTCSIIASVCLSSSSNAFRYGRIPPPRHNGQRPSPTSREYKSSNSLGGDESGRIARQIQQMSSSSSPMPSHNYGSASSGRSQSRTPPSVATLEGSSSESGRGFPDGRGAAEEVVDSLIPNMNLPVGVTVVAGERGNLLMDDVIQVLSASLLVTGNTVGSSMFVLPEAVRGVGLAWGSAIFLSERGAFPPTIGGHDRRRLQLGPQARTTMMTMTPSRQSPPMTTTLILCIRFYPSDFRL